MWGRMVARLAGEVPGATLEAYRRASLPVFELMDRVEARRQACAADGLNPWTIPPATRAEFLCAWNAFVLQTLGNDILDTDYGDYPDTAGFVPPVTADQLMSFFGQVEGWLDRAHQANANPDYELDVPVPAALPPWSRLRPSPPSHVRGLVKAMGAVGEHAAAAMGFLPERAPDGPEQKAQQAQVNRIRQLYASAQSKARYATELHGTGTNLPPGVKERVEPYAREAIEMFYELGQLIADPALASAGAPAKEPPRALAPGSAKAPARNAPKRKSQRFALPGQPGFNEWCLTDPQALDLLQTDRKARRAISQVWGMDPDPELTLAIHAEICAAYERGDVAYAMEKGERIGYWHRCPWSPVYVTTRALKLGDLRLKANQQFVYEVSAAGLNHGEGFVRRVLPGTYHKTDAHSYDDAS